MKNKLTICKVYPKKTLEMTITLFGLLKMKLLSKAQTLKEL